MDDASQSQHVELIVPRELVKLLKTALEQSDLLDRSGKIKSFTADNTHHAIPTLLADEAAADDWVHEQLKQEERPYVGVNLVVSDHGGTRAQSGKGSNLFRSTVYEWLSTLRNPPFSQAEVSELMKVLPNGYCIYPPMLLLPPTTFSSESWRSVIRDAKASELMVLWVSLARVFGVTHVAINAPIPLRSLRFHRSSNTAAAAAAAADTDARDGLNILRSPSGIEPLYGDFGPNLLAQSVSALSGSSGPPSWNQRMPTERDFDKAFWASVRQNGIRQVWAPRYTMFSRGNIKEKARILGVAASNPPPPFTGMRASLSSVDAVAAAAAAAAIASVASSKAVQGCETYNERWTAVDMYAGIGYFAFSYAKSASCALVVGFEMNAWSVEGLRRGAICNGWDVRIVTALPEMRRTDVYRINDDVACTDEDIDMGRCRLLMYQIDNRHAADVINGMRRSIQPVRHVNLGLLPSSRGSWACAVETVDSDVGGWIHIHENFAIQEIEVLAEKARAEIQQLYDDKRRRGCETSLRGEFSDDNHEQREEVEITQVMVVVVLEHVERVKTYAPGVMHCVLDIYLPGFG